MNAAVSMIKGIFDFDKFIGGYFSSTCDNIGNVMTPMVFKPVNVNDSILLDQSFANLLEIIDDLNLDVSENAGVTGDPGFDSEANKNQITAPDLFHSSNRICEA